MVNRTRFRNRWSVVIALAVIAAIVLAAWPDARQGARSALRQLPYVSDLGKAFYDWRYENTRFPDVDPISLGDGKPATEIHLQYPMGLAEDARGRVYIADRGHLIWRIDSDGIARVIAGSGRAGKSLEGGLARETDLGIPEGLGIDDSGRIYFADSRNNKVLRIETNGRLNRIAGTGKRGDGGDGGQARDATLNRPFDVRIGADGVVYIADYGNHRIRAVDTDGVIRAVAGTGTPGRDGDGGLATAAQLREPYGLFLDAAGRPVITDSANHVVRRVNTDGRISTIAGVGTEGYSGDGGPAVAAQLSWPQGGAIDSRGHVLINDEHNSAIRILNADGTISTLVGIGRQWRAQNGTPATQAALLDPEAVLSRADGSILISEGVPENVCKQRPGNASDRAVCAGLVRLVTPEGTLQTFAGKTTFGAWE